MRHLELQEKMVDSSAEWAPNFEGWIVIRVAKGAGYCLSPKTNIELNVGDGLVLGFDHQTRLRASMLCPAQLQFFTVHPEFLGLLTVKELRQLKANRPNLTRGFLVFRLNDRIGQEFAKLFEVCRGNGLPARCAMLKFWAEIITHHSMPAGKSAPTASRLQWQFRQLLAQMPVGELSTHSALALSRQLNCSIRHFRRLFRKEFGVPFRALQSELRMSHARRLLTESGEPINKIARQCGYRHASLFRRIFKKQFGMAPGEWRGQERKAL